MRPAGFGSPPEDAAAAAEGAAEMASPPEDDAAAAECAAENTAALESAAAAAADVDSPGAFLLLLNPQFDAEFAHMAATAYLAPKLSATTLALASRTTNDLRQAATHETRRRGEQYGVRPRPKHHMLRILQSLRFMELKGRNNRCCLALGARHTAVVSAQKELRTFGEGTNGK